MNIAPQNIENLLKADPSSARPWSTATAAPIPCPHHLNAEELTKFAAASRHLAAEPAVLVKHPKI